MATSVPSSIIGNLLDVLKACPYITANPARAEVVKRKLKIGKDVNLVQATAIFIIDLLYCQCRDNEGVLDCLDYVYSELEKNYNDELVLSITDNTIVSILNPTGKGPPPGYDRLTKEYNVFYPDYSQINIFKLSKIVQAKLENVRQQSS